MMTLGEQSVELHAKTRGKIQLASKVPVTNREELSLAYTPGVASVCAAIVEQPNRVWELTSRREWVAIVTDGTAVLGLGDIGPEAALPVMEGKAILFKEFGGVSAFPICLPTKDPDEIVAAVKMIAPSFGGINLEDISAPRCFVIEERLKSELSIPVFHDDQHGTAIVVLAGLLNASRVLGKRIQDMIIAINGAGAAGTAVARMLLAHGVNDLFVLDRRGIVSKERTDLSDAKRRIAELTNRENRRGDLSDALRGVDAFIGVSAPNVVMPDMIRSMARDPIVFALANPIPEIMPADARAAGAAIIATGRSDYANQVNNVLAFPGIFRGVLRCGAPAITEEMKHAAAHALANAVASPSRDAILPNPLDKSVAEIVASAAEQTYRMSNP